MKKYIYVNSYPRSGSTFTETCLNFMYMSNEHEIVLDTPAKLLHSPELLLENLQGILQVSIIRNPAHAISSFMIKDIYELKITPNIQSENFKKYVESKVDYYKQYIDALKINSSNLLIIDFELIKNDIKGQLSIISNLVDRKMNMTIDESIEKSKEYLLNTSTYNQLSNSLPIEKPKLYFDYFNYIENNFDLTKIIEDSKKLIKLH